MLRCRRLTACCFSASGLRAQRTQRNSMLSPDRLSYLSCLELFQSIDRAGLLELLPHLDSRLLPGGETLFRAGESADAMYVILSGRLRVWLERGGAEHAVCALSPGQMTYKIGRAHGG